jgi:hypothetical protein
MSDTLDLITIGRSSVDLYGAQIGGRLEDMGSFDKYIGGSPTNIACGTARLGLKSAVITGVGDEHMGRFIREQLQREGVNTDDDKTAKLQIARVKRMFTAARRNNLEFLLEIIPSKVGPVDDDTSATLIQTFYDAGVHPDWWKLEPFKTEAAWANAADAITRNDPRTRGIVVLGLDAPQKALAASFALAARQPLVKGFAVGRTIFGDAARAWMKGEMTDTEAVAQMIERYWELCKLWGNARSIAQEEAT